MGNRGPFSCADIRTSGSPAFFHHFNYRDTHSFRLGCPEIGFLEISFLLGVPAKHIGCFASHSLQANEVENYSLQSYDLIS